MTREIQPTQQLEPARRQLTLAEYRKLLGQEVGLSKWFEMSQDRINAFAAATEDWTEIHLDPDRAKASFGGTIAHGLLTLSMMSAMAIDALPKIAGRLMAVNYGFDRVRLMTPVRSGCRIRGRFVLTDIADRRLGDIITRTRVTVEIEDFERPALVADWLYHSRFS